MMKRVLVFVLALLICASAAMAEGERRGGRNDGSMDLLNEGIALMNGDGVAQDYEAAMQRFLAADEAGNKKAARYVGLLYAQGLGVEQDYALAESWYEKGVAAGDLTSGYYLGLLYKQGLGVDQDYGKAAEYFASVAASENKSHFGFTKHDDVRAGFSVLLPGRLLLMDFSPSGETVTIPPGMRSRQEAK